MDKAFKPQEVEEKIYKSWEEKGLFKAHIDKSKKPFCIILPPPNANADLHLGHAMYVYEDVMIRYHKLLGDEVLWLPGADHAGIETQFVFEKHLGKKGQSRFDFDRATLYKMIWDFVAENRGKMVQQLKKLGFALDWSRGKYTLDEDIIPTVYKTFKDLYDRGLVYRANRLVNYCTYCGTSYSDYEVKHIERNDPLYFIKYGPFTLATVRPETKFGDTAVAVNPKDRRYKKWIGKEVEVTGLSGKFKLRVVADDFVDPKFGTGVVKVTPAHDFNDWEIGKRHDLEMKQVIGFDGRLNDITGKYKGLKVVEARKKVVEDLKEKGLLEKVEEDYVHAVGTCYRCGRVLEPLPKEQWFIKIRPLADQAKKLVEKGEIKVYPRRFKTHLTRILDGFIDWNISRQIVWGIRIPAYQCKSKVKSQKSKWFISVEKPNACKICGSCDFGQDTDTFDTWFSSGQWPFASLEASPKGFFEYFYPTSVMETGYDILRPWVARMIMLGIFQTEKVPFRNIFLHGLVRDKHGAKMSKSKGNVVNPMEMLERHGADALRAALLFEVAEGADLSFSEDRVRGMRNFANKIWNIARFIDMNREILNSKSQVPNKSKILNDLNSEFEAVKKQYTKDMEGYKFSKALGVLHEFLWHRFADYYIEELKDEFKNGNIRSYEAMRAIYLESLKMLHPFMPFITESVWQIFNGEDKSILMNQLNN